MTSDDRSSAPPPPPTKLEAFANPGARTVRCVIEATRGTRSKFKYDPERGLFKLHRVIPPGLSFPLDFGFVRSLTEARLVGVIEAIQREDGESERNDRLLAVAIEGEEYDAIRRLRDVPRHAIEAVETFFVAYNALDDIEFKVRVVKGAEAALRLIRRGQTLFRKKN
jgi:inorganic pyrophosphatase